MLASVASGLPCTGRTLKRYAYYTCAGKRAMEAASKGGRCRSRLTPVGQLDEVVWKDLCELIRRPELIALELERAWGGQWLPQEMQARRTSVRKARVSLEQHLERLTEAYMGGIIRLEEYARRRRELEEKMGAFKSQDRELEQQAERRQELSGMVNRIEDYCRRVSEGLAGATFEQKRRLIELLIDRVIVYLALGNIDHTTTKVKSLQANGICERFHKTILNEFYRVALRKEVVHFA